MARSSPAGLKPAGATIAAAELQSLRFHSPAGIADVGALGEFQAVLGSRTAVRTGHGGLSRADQSQVSAVLGGHPYEQCLLGGPRHPEAVGVSSLHGFCDTPESCILQTDVRHSSRQQHCLTVRLPRGVMPEVPQAGYSRARSRLDSKKSWSRCPANDPL